jgi:hypothetical protein
MAFYFTPDPGALLEDILEVLGELKIFTSQDLVRKPGCDVNIRDVSRALGLLNKKG